MFKETDLTRGIRPKQKKQKKEIKNNNINNFLYYYTMSSNSNTTLVTAFVAGANERNDRGIDDYIRYGKKLLESPINKVVFFDDSLIGLLPNYPNTIIIPIKKEEMYLYEYKNKITNFSVNTQTPEKDSLEYMFLMCNKTEFIRKAIELNPFQTDQFVWVDFGINHMIKNSNKTFQSLIVAMENKRYENVRIASIWGPEMHNIIINTFRINPYKDIMWYFAGSIFGGESKSLIKFADLTKKQCIKIIEERKTLMWEVNVWFLLYLENPELFSLYNCDHNESILGNY